MTLDTLNLGKHGTIADLGHAGLLETTVGSLCVGR